MKRAQNMHWLKNQVDDVMLPCVASALNHPKAETLQLMMKHLEKRFGERAT